MIVCVCHRVSDRQIAAEAAAGCTNFEALQEELRVGTSCGACLDCARETWDAACAARRAAAPARPVHRLVPVPA